MSARTKATYHLRFASVFVDLFGFPHSLKTKYYLYSKRIFAVVVSFHFESILNCLTLRIAKRFDLKMVCRRVYKQTTIRGR